jgi:hypothetical protein
VYRIVQPPRSRTVIEVRPLYGGPDLEVYEGWAKTVYRRRGRIGGSYRAGRSLDGFFSQQFIAASSRGLDRRIPRLGPSV